MDSAADDPGPVLVTERLHLRPWKVEEAAIHRRLWIDRDPRVPVHRRIDAEGRPSIGDLEDWIRRSTAESGPGLGLLALERITDGAVLGYCGLVHDGPGSAALEGDPPGPEIAFELLRAAQGHGYATEAGRAVIRWAREAAVERVHATVWAWNTASLRVLDRLGFETRSRRTARPKDGELLVLTTVL
ncbi:GNAT family N-acetyltransferase [uncultured Brachybacterium sp.]|uniref:GNAT family N-acetyltransferase n=1 Tax=uncultured Brachybacterium sp. TaxID=189680 RepID=UPI002609180C|nr:GNAT family N-acetyltransferase [uncultured Brachybacterium sp.]